MKIAHEMNVVLIPYGGGTNVSKALFLNTSEKRMIVSVDLMRVSFIYWG